MKSARLRFGDVPDEDQVAVASRTYVIFRRARAEKLRLLMQLSKCTDAEALKRLVRQVERIDEYERKSRSRLLKDLARLSPPLIPPC